MLRLQRLYSTSRAQAVNVVMKRSKGYTESQLARQGVPSVGASFASDADIGEYINDNKDLYATL